MIVTIPSAAVAGEHAGSRSKVATPEMVGHRPARFAQRSLPGEADEDRTQEIRGARHSPSLERLYVTQPARRGDTLPDHPAGTIRMPGWPQTRGRRTKAGPCGASMEPILKRPRPQIPATTKGARSGSCSRLSRLRWSLWFIVRPDISDDRVRVPLQPHVRVSSHGALGGRENLQGCGPVSTWSAPHGRWLSVILVNAITASRSRCGVSTRQRQTDSDPCSVETTFAARSLPHRAARGPLVSRETCAAPMTHVHAAGAHGQDSMFHVKRMPGTRDATLWLSWLGRT
ncbi:hypothetical protein QF036_000222 [Arthrobacter globiformis]|nr:hypothetical protein [Arthrobacter globiformis]